MSKLKVAVVDYDFTANTMPVLRALNYCGSFPIPDKSKRILQIKLRNFKEKEICFYK